MEIKRSLVTYICQPVWITLDFTVNALVRFIQLLVEPVRRHELS